MEETRNPNPPTANEPPAPAEPIGVDELLSPGLEAGREPPGPKALLPPAASILESLLLVSTEPVAVDKARRLLGGLSLSQVGAGAPILQSRYPAEPPGSLG